MRKTAAIKAAEQQAAATSLFENDSDRSPMPESSGQAIRGVFELRPSLKDDGEPVFSQDGSVRAWTLWWRPLPRLAQDDDGTVRQVGVTPGVPVEVATDLAYCRWQVFDDRKRQADFAAVYFRDLPAYIEMEVMTVSGVWANWMFEVDWATGSESAGRNDDDGQDQGDQSQPSTPQGGASTTGAKLPATGGGGK
jgi:hypothetical protein